MSDSFNLSRSYHTPNIRPFFFRLDLADENSYDVNGAEGVDEIHEDEDELTNSCTKKGEIVYCLFAQIEQRKNLFYLHCRSDFCHSHYIIGIIILLWALIVGNIL